MAVKLQFLDKRDQEGKILQYEALELNFKLTKNIFKIFKKKSIYCKLIKIFPEKYVQFYFEKYFFELFTEISNQYTIYKHDEKTLKNEDLINKLIQFLDLLIEVAKNNKKILIFGNGVALQSQVIFRKMLDFWG